MRTSKQSFFHPAVMKQVTGINHMRRDAVALSENDPRQLDMFDLENSLVVDHQMNLQEAAGVRLNAHDVEHIKKCLFAKYLSHCLGQSGVFIAAVLGVSRGHASRLVRAKLPVTANPMSIRTVTDQQMKDMGLREVNHPDACTTHSVDAASSIARKLKRERKL